MGKMHYRKLAIMTVLSFISMYILMYSMVNSIDSVYNNFNQIYMAGVMTAPMVIIGILVMSSMYTNQRLNLILITVSVVALLLFFFFIRQQTAIGDTQFLRSMIPHHSGAILMCEQASIQDPEIQALCASIIESQQEEIDQMETILQRLE
jgi:hypothetical protein